MTAAWQERSPYGVAVFLEHRGGRGTVASIPQPNGSVACSSDYGFVVAALGLTVGMWIDRD